MRSYWSWTTMIDGTTVSTTQIRSDDLDRAHPDRVRQLVRAGELIQDAFANWERPVDRPWDHDPGDV